MTLLCSAIQVQAGVVKKSLPSFFISLGHISFSKNLVYLAYAEF